MQLVMNGCLHLRFVEPLLQVFASGFSQSASGNVLSRMWRRKTWCMSIISGDYKSSIGEPSVDCTISRKGENEVLRKSIEA